MMLHTRLFLLLGTLVLCLKQGKCSEVLRGRALWCRQVCVAVGLDACGDTNPMCLDFDPTPPSVPTNPPTKSACVCKTAWTSPEDPGCGTTQYGCPQSACDDDSSRWCISSNSGCAQEDASDPGWHYCSAPAPTKSPTDSPADSPTDAPTASPTRYYGKYTQEWSNFGSCTEGTKQGPYLKSFSNNKNKYTLAWCKDECDQNDDCTGFIKTSSGCKLMDVNSNCTPKGSGNPGLAYYKRQATLPITAAPTTAAPTIDHSAAASSTNCHMELQKRALDCPSGTPRSEHDWHNPFGDDWSSRSNSEITAECCSRSCFSEFAAKGIACNPGKEVRNEGDFHQPPFSPPFSDWDSDTDGFVDFLKKECCRSTCWGEMQSRGYTCNEDDRMKNKNDHHQPSFVDDGDWSKGTEEDFKNECCETRCSTVMSARGLTCTQGEPRDHGDWHSPFSHSFLVDRFSDENVLLQCCQNKCFGNFKGTCPGDKIPRGENDGHNCGEKCDQADECCIDDNRCEMHFTGKCEPGFEVSTKETCWLYDGGEGKWNCENCCRHPMEEKCQSDEAQKCSKCSKFAPCTRSVDPRCITQDALDCLSCAGNSDCAICAVGWDNCLGIRVHDGFGCKAENFQYEIPVSTDGSCFENPIFPGSFTQNVLSGKASELGYKRECTDSSCKNCKEIAKLSTKEAKESIANITKGSCEDQGEDGESRYEYGSFYPDLGKNKCPDARPCGPKSCVPGVDDKCIVITVFGPDSECVVERDVAKYSTVGDYHSLAIADGECHQDGSGRSFYKIDYDYLQDTGNGKIGCSDSKCTLDCVDTTMKREVCTTEPWTNGLQIAVTGNKNDWLKQIFGNNGGCVPGKDALCIAITLFEPTSECSIQADASKHASVGDYHLSAIADGVCRKGGDGYFKLTHDFSTNVGTAHLRCSNKMCTKGCTKISLEREKCTSVEGLAGLNVVVTGLAMDFVATCSTMKMKECKKNKATCLWSKRKCWERTAKPTKAPTTPKPTNAPTEFSCANLKKKFLCIGKKYGALCTWKGNACEERAPTAPPTDKPTKAPTAFACENFTKKMFCVNKVNRAKCTWNGKSCENLPPTAPPTDKPTKAPTAFACENFTKKILCVNKVNRAKCAWDGKACVAKTDAPTDAPTAYSCENTVAHLCSIMNVQICKRAKGVCKWANKKCSAL